MEELADLKYSYKRVKEELKNQTDDNGYLLKQIKGLELSIKNLEAANLHLFEQKERLTESKRQLEILQTQKEELFAHAIHDIKNPASAIKSYLELLNSYDLKCYGTTGNYGLLNGIIRRYSKTFTGNVYNNCSKQTGTNAKI